MRLLLWDWLLLLLPLAPSGSAAVDGAGEGARRRSADAGQTTAPSAPYFLAQRWWCCRVTISAAPSVLLIAGSGSSRLRFRLSW